MKMVEVFYTTDPAGLDERLDRLMEALVAAGVPDPAVGATLSIGEVHLTMGSEPKGEDLMSERRWTEGDRVTFPVRHGWAQGTVVSTDYGRIINGRRLDLIVVRHDSDGHPVVHGAKELRPAPDPEPSP
jgi:hypothetical protein